MAGGITIHLASLVATGADVGDGTDAVEYNENSEEEGIEIGGPDRAKSGET